VPPLAFSWRTVKEYIRKFLSLHLTVDEAELLEDIKLHQVFFPPAKSLKVPDQAQLDRLEAMLPTLVKMSRQKGMTLEKLWKQYLAQDPSGHSRTWFYLHLRDYNRRSSTRMHLEHKAGEKMFVDYCG
jgi:transposase